VKEGKRTLEVKNMGHLKKKT